ncbi:hypothetical protein DYE49_05640 [Treponema rectale]|uniref:Lipoprotein n=1 Tax=Treponema rectale TaxID=744512 RepID=A0A840S6Z9_9SPIR|nr:hypothetical protein [Treponema rectale]MBB5218339.1 hypothetical protein [Treponema rectale]QOS39962.1 hypothetical protein DYE49_05640 [Treponema rectale]
MKKIIFKTLSAIVCASVFFISCAGTKAEGGSQVENVPAAETPSVPGDAEYQRSKGNVDVSEEEFTNDKKQILVTITKLEAIMANMDYSGWYSYLDEESIEYWSKSVNLKRAAGRLPVKGLKLNSLSDYFKFVFVPARAGRTIDEIRYETKDTVKVVQFQEDTDTIYYNFNRIDGKWKLHLPALDD